MNELERWANFYLLMSAAAATMQKIDRSEPDPALFQIPPDYAVSESVATPRERGDLNTDSTH
jgi:hypothetical protein